MKAIINPERLVSVPFNKTQCDVDFYINTGESKDICGVLTEHKAFKTDFFSFYFFRRANGYLLLSFRKVELRDGMVLLLSPHQQQEWHVNEVELDYTFLIFREDFMRTFIADKFFVYRLLYYYPQILNFVCCGLMGWDLIRLVMPMSGIELQIAADVHSYPLPHDAA